MNIEVGDLITLKGFKNKNERPVGLVISNNGNHFTNVMWLKEKYRNRFALRDYIESSKIELVSKAT